jgi:hypothetical protein
MHTYIHTDRETNRQAGRQAGRQTETDRQTDRETDRQRDRQTDRQTHTQTHTHTEICDLKNVLVASFKSTLWMKFNSCLINKSISSPLRRPTVQYSSAQ